LGGARMEPLRLPADLAAFLAAGGPLEYDPSTCEAGAVTLLPLSGLRLLVVVWYNFGWCVRTLREQVQQDPPRYRYRTPAMAAGLADHAWSMHELLCYPLYPPKDPPPRPVRTYEQVLKRLQKAQAKRASG